MTMYNRLWVAAAAQILVLAGCVPAVMAPTAAVTPGPGKLPTDFAADQAGCSAQANHQIAPAIQAANNQIVGNALLGVATTPQSAQATLQKQFDAAYSECMYAKGENVPGLTPAATVEEPPPPPAHHVKHYARKKPTTTTTNASFVEPTPAAASGGGSFVEPAPAAAAPPPPAATGGGFAVPPPTSH